VLRGANSVWGLRLRQYRVSHLGAETAEDNLEIAGGDRGGPGAGPRRLHVVLVVRAGAGAVPAAPLAAVHGVPLSLAGGIGARPLACPQPGVWLEQGLAEGTAFPTTSPRGPGHEGTSSAESAITPWFKGRGWVEAGRLPDQSYGWLIHGREETTEAHSPSPLMI
jgi:hypothetical protein